MSVKNKIYDLLLQNNASKEFFIYSGLADISASHLYYEFDLELDVPDGEYTYCVQANDEQNVIYDLKTPLLSTILHVEENEILLRDLQPDTGLLQIGEGKPIFENIYDKTQDNDTIFYYDN